MLVTFHECLQVWLLVLIFPWHQSVLKREKTNLLIVETLLKTLFMRFRLSHLNANRPTSLFLWIEWKLEKELKKTRKYLWEQIKDVNMSDGICSTAFWIEEASNWKRITSIFSRRCVRVCISEGQTIACAFPHNVPVPNRVVGLLASNSISLTRQIPLFSSKQVLIVDPFTSLVLAHYSSFIRFLTVNITISF